jgi:predicted acyltransferase
MSEPHHYLTGTSSASRLVSIDAFRGLTILLMVFVNELGGMKGVPGWLKHYPAAEDGMTFVDVVFPAFLFVMGMAVPFALGRRMAQGHCAVGAWAACVEPHAGSAGHGRVFM